LGDAFDGVTLALIDRLNRVRKDPEVIGGGDADAGIAVIDAKCRVRGVAELRVQIRDELVKLRWQDIDELFDRVRLMAVGNE
jgi:hypothetical protein